MKNLLFLIPLFLLSACASANLYNEPDLGATDAVIVKGLHPNIKILRVDGENTRRSPFKGAPNSIRVLPGKHNLFAAYELNPVKSLASGNSSIEINGKAGETYFIRHQFYGQRSEKLYFWLLDSKLNPIYNKDDLPANIDEIVSKYGFSFYQLPAKYTTDFFLSLVRQKAFENPWSASNSLILLSFGLINKKEQFNCDEFFSKLNEKQQDIVREQMKKYPFVCKDSNYTEEDAYNSFKEFLPQNIKTNEAADAHWAWYSATGNNDILKRFLDNYLGNKETCVDCIEWSYPSIAEQNTDVKNYLFEYMKDKKSPNDRARLEKLLPQNKEFAQPD